MKKLIFGGIMAAMLGTGAFYASQKKQTSELSEIQMANIEALSESELSQKCGGCSTSYNGNYCCTVYLADINLYQRLYYPKTLF